MARWTVWQARQRLAEGAAPLVDLRSSAELAGGRIEGADHLPLYELDARGRPLPHAGFAAALSRLAAGAAAGPPMLICAQGLRSRQAAALAALAGAVCDEVPGGVEGSDLADVFGSPLAVGWRAAGLPLR